MYRLGQVHKITTVGLSCFLRLLAFYIDVDSTYHFQCLILIIRSSTSFSPFLHQNLSTDFSHSGTDGVTLFSMIYLSESVAIFGLNVEGLILVQAYFKLPMSSWRVIIAFLQIPLMNPSRKRYIQLCACNISPPMLRDMACDMTISS